MLVALARMVDCLLYWRTGHLQLTFIIGAPECYNPDPAIDSCPLLVRQNVDVWSLGCVLSEAAVFVVHGFEGVLDYRKQRKTENSANHHFQDGDCFHDGQKVLNAVKAQHTILPKNVRASDHVTRDVLEHLVDNMLVGDTDCRLPAHYLHKKSLRIIQKAKDVLVPLGGDPFGHQQIRPQTPPELPTDLDPRGSNFPARLRTPPKLPMYDE